LGRKVWAKEKGVLLFGPRNLDQGRPKKVGVIPSYWGKRLGGKLLGDREPWFPNKLLS